MGEGGGRVTPPYQRTSKARKESALEAWCVSYARARGVQVGKLSECVGLPDRIFFTPRKKGGPLVPEFKRPDGKGEASPAQEWHVKKLKEMGYSADFIASRKEFLELLKRKGVE